MKLLRVIDDYPPEELLELPTTREGRCVFCGRIVGCCCGLDCPCSVLKELPNLLADMYGGSLS